MEDKRQEIENLVKEKFGIDAIDYNATLETYGLDSLEVVEFALDLEDTYHITFETEETKDLKTLGNLIELTLKKLK